MLLTKLLEPPYKDERISVRSQSPIGAESTRQMTETQQDLMLCRTIIEGILPEGNGRLVYNNQLSSREHTSEILFLRSCFVAGLKSEIRVYTSKLECSRSLKGIVPLY